MHRIEIIQGDITELDVDAVVNAANSELRGGGGVDGAIHRAAGSELFAACQKIGYCPAGEAVITPGFKLKARHVIHTVGPVWSGGNQNEAEILRNCYQNVFQLVKKHKFKTVAFSAISTGVYGYPPADATSIALFEAKTFLSDNKDVEKLIFVCFNNIIFNIYQTEFYKIFRKET